MIEVNNVTKNYNEFTAVKNISFKVEKGEIFGLLGENGAGKTTILRMISSIINPSSGNIIINGSPCILEKKNIGVVTDKTKIYESLTVKENLEFFGSFYNLKKDKLSNMIEWLISNLELENYYTKVSGELSQGNRQKLNIARGLIGSPKVLILDEIMNGLDITSQQSVRKVLNIFKKYNRCILFTSHNMADVKLICDKIAVIHKGIKTYEGEIKDYNSINSINSLENLVKEGYTNEY